MSVSVRSGSPPPAESSATSLSISTDVHSMSKLLMMIQSLASLLTVALVKSRAVNILN
jgi:hypothetical protein